MKFIEEVPLNLIDGKAMHYDYKNVCSRCAFNFHMKELSVVNFVMNIGGSLSMYMNYQMKSTASSQKLLAFVTEQQKKLFLTGEYVKVEYWLPIS